MKSGMKIPCIVFVLIRNQVDINAVKYVMREVLDEVRALRNVLVNLEKKNEENAAAAAAAAANNPPRRKNALQKEGWGTMTMDKHIKDGKMIEKAEVF